MSGKDNFTAAAEDTKATLRNATVLSGADKSQAQAILALAFAMQNIAEAIGDVASAQRYGSR